MKRSHLLLLLLCGVLAGLIIAGCSDDDKTVNSTVNPTGLDSARAELYDELVGNVPGEVGQISLELTLGLVERQSNPPKSWALGPTDASDFDSVAWSYSNGWNIFYLEFSSITVDTNGMDIYMDTLTIWGWDSLRYFEGNVVAAEPSDTTDSVWSHQHFGLRSGDNEGEVWNGKVHQYLRLADAGSDALGSWITVSLTTTDTIDATLFSPHSDSCSLGVVTTANFANILFPLDSLESVCPTSGNISAQQVVDLACVGDSTSDTLNINGTWIVTASYVNGTESTEVRFGPFRFTSTEDCGLPRPGGTK